MRAILRPTQAITLLAWISIAGILLSVSMLLSDLRKREIRDSQNATISMVQFLSHQTRQTFEGIDVLLQTIKEKLESEYGRQFATNGLATHFLLGSRISGMSQVDDLFLVDSDGMVVNSSHNFPVPPLDISDRDYFRAFVGQPSRKSLFFGKPVRSRIDGKWTLNISRELRDPNGVFLGIVVAVIKIDNFEKQYNYVHLDFDRPISIHMADGTLIAGIPHKEALIGLVPPDLRAAEIPREDAPIRMFTHTSALGSTEDFALGRVGNFPLLVSVVNDQTEALSSWREIAIPIGGGALLVCFIIATSAMLLVRRIRAEEQLGIALADANSRYLHTVNSVMDAIIASDENQNIVLFNKAAEKLFGYTSREILGTPLDKLIGESLRNIHRQHFESFRSTRDEIHSVLPPFEMTGRHKDGSVLYLESSISHTTINGNHQFTAVLRDISLRRKAELELRTLNRQLRGLSASLQDVREQERNRIARELHDDLGQQLTGLKLDFAWLHKQLKDSTSVAAEELERMRETLNGTISTVRRISTELRPFILDDLGLAEAIKWQAQEVRKRSGLEISLLLDGVEHIDDPAMSTVLFRIVQESLTNVVRHAQASKVDIRLDQKNENVELCISDNGKGFASNEDNNAGFGLVSMRERAISADGHLAVTSSSTGTTIQVVLPLVKSATNESKK